MGKQALLIIDMLNDFARPGGALYCGESARHIIPRIQEEIRRFRAEGKPVVYVCDNHRPDDPEFEVWPAHCVRGTDGAQVVEELRPQEGDYVIPKRRYSGFYGTDLDLTLRELGVDDLVLTGTCTNICVLYTAADARMRDYKVTVLKDGVATFSPEAHAAALRELKETLGAEVA